MNPLRALRAADPAGSLPTDAWDERADAVLREAHERPAPIEHHPRRAAGSPARRPLRQVIVVGVTAAAVVAGSLAVLSSVHPAFDGAAGRPSTTTRDLGGPLPTRQAQAIADANMAAVAVPGTAKRLSASPDRWLDAPSSGLADCRGSQQHIVTAAPRFYSDGHLSLQEAVAFYRARVPAGLATYRPGGATNGDGTTSTTVAYSSPQGSRYPERVLVYILQTPRGLDIRVDSMVNAEGLCSAR